MYASTPTVCEHPISERLMWNVEVLIHVSYKLVSGSAQTDISSLKSTHLAAIVLGLCSESTH
jgi:hypothetical protein